MARTTLRLMHTAPPTTFLVFDTKTDNCIGKVRLHQHLDDEHYWTVGTDPEAPSYSTRSDVVRALQNEPKN